MICWWCGATLKTYPNHTRDYYVKLQTGHEVRVHKGCQEDAARAVKPVTAQPPDSVTSQGVTSAKS